MVLAQAATSVRGNSWDRDTAGRDESAPDETTLLQDEYRLPREQ